jgi:hypothetical protein
MPRPDKFTRMAAAEADRLEKCRLLEKQRRALMDLQTEEERAEREKEEAELARDEAVRWTREFRERQGPSVVNTS